MFVCLLAKLQVMSSHPGEGVTLSKLHADSRGPWLSLASRTSAGVRAFVLRLNPGRAGPWVGADA